MENKDLISKVNELLVGVCGPLALKRQKETNPAFRKKDGDSEISFYTKTDVEIENLMKERFMELSPTYGFIGEESTHANILRGLDTQTISSNTKSWVFDPIDGTLCWRSGGKNWGISVGLIEERERGILNMPAGAVYFPAHDSLYFNRGHDLPPCKIIDVSNSSSRMTRVKSPRNHLLPPIEERIVAVKDKDQAMEYLDDKLDYDSAPGSYSFQVIGVMEGLYIGAITQAYLWDIAGCHAVSKANGVRTYDIRTGKEVKSFTINHFEKKGNKLWRLKRPHLVCYKEVKSFLLSHIKASHEFKK